MRKILLLVVVILLISSFSSNAFGQKMGLKAIAPQIGIIFPESPFGTGFDIGAVANLGQFYKNIGLYPSLQYWSAGGDENGVDWSMSNFQIAGDVHYYTEDLEGFFAGLGLSLNFLSVEAEIKETIFGQVYSGSASESKTRVGFAMFPGYEMPISKYTGFAKAKYELISDVNTFKIDIGMYFDMGK